jgi:uncharacterized protein
MIILFDFGRISLKKESNSFLPACALKPVIVSTCISIFVCYQGVGSLGRLVQDGVKETKMYVEGKEEVIKIEMEVETITGFSAHAGRNELLSFFNDMRPKSKRIIINHGEVSKSLDLASALYKLNRIETNVPRTLDTVRLR